MIIGCFQQIVLNHIIVCELVASLRPSLGRKAFLSMESPKSQGKSLSVLLSSPLSTFHSPIGLPAPLLHWDLAKIYQRYSQ